LNIDKKTSNNLLIWYPTHGILTTYPWYFDSYPWYFDPHDILIPYPWYFNPLTHSILNPMPMLFWHPGPWCNIKFEQTYGILTPMVFWSRGKFSPMVYWAPLLKTVPLYGKMNSYGMLTPLIYNQEGNKIQNGNLFSLGVMDIPLYNELNFQKGNHITI
jgi:hypothetical protein